MIIEILGGTSELYTWKSTENTKKELMTTVEEMVNILLKKKNRFVEMITFYIKYTRFILWFSNKHSIAIRSLSSSIEAVVRIWVDGEL